MLTLSVVSTPFLGFGRAVSVLVANFAYDYRVFVPLGTIRFLRTAQAYDIHIRNACVRPAAADGRAGYRRRRR
ncbi:MAG: hypothetical protein R3A10_06260 [Caldilineaceae bacterium]